MAAMPVMILEKRMSLPSRAELRDEIVRRRANELEPLGVIGIVRRGGDFDTPSGNPRPTRAVG